MGERQSNGEAAVYTREKIAESIAEISKKMVETNNAYLHALITINNILRLPNAEELLTEELKNQLRDLWIKLKSTGLTVNDPPILFGVPPYEGDANYQYS